MCCRCGSTPDSLPERSEFQQSSTIFSPEPDDRHNPSFSSKKRDLCESDCPTERNESCFVFSTARILSNFDDPAMKSPNLFQPTHIETMGRCKSDARLKKNRLIWFQNSRKHPVFGTSSGDGISRPGADHTLSDMRSSVPGPKALIRTNAAEPHSVLRFPAELLPP